MTGCNKQKSIVLNCGAELNTWGKRTAECHKANTNVSTSWVTNSHRESFWKSCFHIWDLIQIGFFSTCRVILEQINRLVHKTWFRSFISRKKIGCSLQTATATSTLPSGWIWWNWSDVLWTKEREKYIAKRLQGACYKRCRFNITRHITVTSPPDSDIQFDVVDHMNNKDGIQTLIIY